MRLGTLSTITRYSPRPAGGVRETRRSIAPQDRTKAITSDVGDGPLFIPDVRYSTMDLAPQTTELMADAVRFVVRGSSVCVRDIYISYCLDPRDTDKTGMTGYQVASDK